MTDPASHAGPAPGLAPLGAARGGGVRRRRRAWPWVLGALLLLAAIAFAALNRRTEVQVGSVVTAYPSAQYALITASGYVVAQRRAAVSSKATGRLVELRVREGSVVKAGELIARLDAADVQAGTLAAQAGVRQAAAGKAQAQASLSQAELELDTAQAELKRLQPLQAQGYIASQQVDNARRRVDTAQAGIAAARAAIASAESSQAAAAAQVRAQQVSREATEIRAPFNGVVLVKNANVGDMITPFSSAGGTQGAVVTMADMTTLEVEADVSEANVGRVKTDMPVEIVLDALPGQRFRGLVSRIVPTVDRAKATVMVKVRFEELDARILPEMSAKVVFLSQRPGDADFKPVTAVNPKALAERDGRQVVFRVEGSADAMTVRMQPVTPGRTLGDVVELTGGELNAGDRLVLAPAPALATGARVAVAAK